MACSSIVLIFRFFWCCIVCVITAVYLFPTCHYSVISFIIVWKYKIQCAIFQQSHPKKKYHCSECPISFNNNKNLKRHSLVHTTQKSFHCGLCDKSFKVGTYNSRMVLGKPRYTSRTGKLSIVCTVSCIVFNTLLKCVVGLYFKTWYIT